MGRGVTFSEKKSEYFWQYDLSSIPPKLRFFFYFVFVFFHVIIASHTEKIELLRLYFFSLFLILWLSLPLLARPWLRSSVFLEWLPPSLQRFLCVRVCLQMLLIIIPLHIVYVEIVRNILISVGKFCIMVLILLKNVYIPWQEMSRSTFI